MTRKPYQIKIKTAEISNLERSLVRLGVDILTSVVTTNGTDIFKTYVVELSEEELSYLKLCCLVNSFEEIFKQ